jgi:steroid delta-isomerase-like uncharacterized protein
MPEAQKAAIIEWFDQVWNKKSREAIDQLLPDDCVIHDAGNSTKGPEEFKPYFDRMHTMFSDVHVDIHDVVSDGQYACARWTVRMRHTGEGLGVPATGQQASASGMTMVRFVDGKFAEAWQNWDMLGLLGQLQAQAAQPEFKKLAMSGDG